MNYEHTSTHLFIRQFITLYLPAHSYAVLEANAFLILHLYLFHIYNYIYFILTFIFISYLHLYLFHTYIDIYFIFT